MLSEWEDSVYYEFNVDRQMELEEELGRSMGEGDEEGTVRIYRQLSRNSASLLGRDMRKIKNNAIMAIGRFGREAISRGTPPGTAFLRTQSNLRKIEKCRTGSEVEEIVLAVLLDSLRQRKPEKPIEHSLPVRRAMSFISNRIFRNPVPRDVAESVSLSTGYLSRLFKRETGLTLNSYIHKIRIEAAKGLLSDTGKSASEIAESLGYKSQSYFNYIFRKIEGCSPREFLDDLQP